MLKANATILIIDDDEDVLLSAKLLLKKQFENVITRNNPKEINQLISKENIDVIVLDMNYRIGFNDGKEGIYWLKHILSINPQMVIILMTASGGVGTYEYSVDGATWQRVVLTTGPTIQTEHLQAIQDLRPAPTGAHIMCTWKHLQATGLDGEDCQSGP